MKIDIKTFSLVLTALEKARDLFNVGVPIPAGEYPEEFSNGWRAACSAYRESGASYLAEIALAKAELKKKEEGNDQPNEL